MARTTDILQILVEVDGDGQARAKLVGIGDASEDTGKKLRGAAGGASAFADAIGAISVGKLVEGFIRSNREAERLRIELRRLEGSQENVNSRLGEMRDIARDSGASVSAVTSAYVQLQKAGLDPMNGSLRALIDQSASLGDAHKDLESLTARLTSAYERGALSAGDLNALNAQGVNVYRALNKITGEHNDTIRDMAVQGKLGRDSIKALIDELGRENFGAAAEKAESFDGVISELKINAAELAVVLGDSGLMQTVISVISHVSEGIKVFSEMTSAVDDTGQSTSIVSQLIQGLSAAVSTALAVVKLAGAGVGVFVDYLLALADAAESAMISVNGYYTAVKLAMSGDFSGAKDAVAQSAEDSAAAFDRAKDRVANAHSAFASTFHDIAGQLEADLMSIGQASDKAADKTEKAGQSAAGASKDVSTLSDATKTARTDTDRLIASLQKQIDTYGKSEVQILRMEAAQLKAAGATKAQAAELDRLIDSYERLLRQDAAVEAMMADYERVLDDAADALRAFTDLQAAQAREMGGPYVEAALRYADAMEVIAAAERALMLELDDAAEVAKRTAQARSDAIKQYTDDLAAAEQQVRQAAIQQLQGFERVWMQGAADLGPALTDALMSGEWGNVGKRLATSIIGGMLDAFMDEQVVKPLQNAMLEAFSNEQSGGGFMGFFRGIFAQGSASGTGASGASGDAAGGIGGMGGALASNPIGWILAGMAANNSLFSSGWQTGAGGGVGGGMWHGLSLLGMTPKLMMLSDSLLRSLGMSDRVASLLTGSSIMQRFFGRKAPEITASGISGTFGFDGFDGQSFADIYQRGGVFRSSRRSTEMGELDSSIDAALDRVIAQVRRGVIRLADSLDADITDALDRVRISARLELSDDPEEAKRQIEQYVHQMVDQLSQAALDALGYGLLPELAGITAGDALTGLQDLLTYVDELGSRLDQLDGSPLTQLRIALDQVASAEQAALADLNDAIAGFDPAEIAAAAANAEAAVVARYNREIEMIRALEEALLAAEQQARQMDLLLAQRIAGVSGDSSIAADAARVGMITSQALVQGSVDPERALMFLDEFVGNVDAWLQSSIAHVNELMQAEQQRINAALAGIAEQQQALQSALASLSSERDAIIAGAQQRAQEAAAAATAAAQASQQAQQAAHQAQIEALQEQLNLAMEFERVLQRARDMIEQLTFGAANPLGGQARLALLDQEIAAAEAAMAGASGADQAAAAARILELLQQRLQLVQSEGLMQRPGEDYLELYNDTLARIAGVVDIAEPEADLAEQLAQELNDIQQRTLTTVRGIATSVSYTAEEQARLNAIAEEEAAIQAELLQLEEDAAALQAELLQVQRDAEAQIAQLNTEAQEYYVWARAEAERLNAERAKDLQDQIDAITGGRPIEAFIADRQAEATRLLGEIHADLRTFLDAIASGSSTYVPIGPGAGGGGGGGGGSPGNPSDPEFIPGTLSIPTTIHVTTGSGDPAQIAQAVSGAIAEQMPQLASRIKREMSTA